MIERHKVVLCCVNCLVVQCPLYLMIGEGLLPAFFWLLHGREHMILCSCPPLIEADMLGSTLTIDGEIERPRRPEPDVYSCWNMVANTRLFCTWFHHSDLMQIVVCWRALIIPAFNQITRLSNRTDVTFYRNKQIKLFETWTTTRMGFYNKVPTAS